MEEAKISDGLGCLDVRRKTACGGGQAGEWRETKVK